MRLVATARSSREQPLVLKIPKEAEVQKVTIDEDERPARPENGELRVTLPAGEHTLEVTWQQARGMGVFYGLPRVSFSSPAVNVTQQLTVPPERWLLATRGPAWGPAVLFWSYLVFLLAVAYGLGRLPASPLTTTQWVLLGLGLSVLPAVEALIVAAFVFALALRAKRPPATSGPSTASSSCWPPGRSSAPCCSTARSSKACCSALTCRSPATAAPTRMLRWYADRVSGDTPAAGVLSLPLWLYRVAMLLWALWLASSLVRGVGPGWRAFNEGGLWRPLPKRLPKPPEARRRPERRQRPVGLYCAMKTSVTVFAEGPSRSSSPITE